MGGDRKNLPATGTAIGYGAFHEH